jgi:hypothetical protein
MFALNGTFSVSSKFTRHFKDMGSAPSLERHQNGTASAKTGRFAPSCSRSQF